MICPMNCPACNWDSLIARHVRSYVIDPDGRWFTSPQEEQLLIVCDSCGHEVTLLFETVDEGAGFWHLGDLESSEAHMRH